MRFNAAQQEVILGGYEMEAVSISCDVFTSQNRASLPIEEIEKLQSLSIRAAKADFTLPDPKTGEKEFSISRTEAELAIMTARQFSPSKEMVDFIPKSTQAAIAEIALFEIDKPGN